MDPYRTITPVVQEAKSPVTSAVQEAKSDTQSTDSLSVDQFPLPIGRSSEVEINM